MDIDQERIQELAAALERLEQVDPADLPEPAAELATLLSQILDALEQ